MNFRVLADVDQTSDGGRKEGEIRRVKGKDVGEES